MQPNSDSFSVSFNRAKAWSDYIGFHIRLFAAMTFSYLCLGALPGLRGEDTEAFLLLPDWIVFSTVGLIFVAYAITMFIHLNRVTTDFIEAAIGGVVGIGSFLLMIAVFMFQSAVTLMLFSVLAHFARNGVDS